MIAARIEQRIRRGFYRDSLPVNETLQNEFRVARQTITCALRLLFRAGILRCTSPRNGIQIVRENINSGTIAIVSNHEIGWEDKALLKEIMLDGFEYKMFDLEEFEKNLEADIAKFCGFLFLNSSLRRETADTLSAANIPFVACNKITWSTQTSCVDYDEEANIRYLLKYLTKQNYRRIGFFYSSPLECYNKSAMKMVRCLKRECGLPLFASDRFVFSEKESVKEELKRFLNLCLKKKSFPDALIVKSNFCHEIFSFAKESGIEIPDTFKLVYLRARQERVPAYPWVLPFHVSPPNWRLWLQGYEILRGRILAPESAPVRQWVSSKIILEH